MESISSSCNDDQRTIGCLGGENVICPSARMLELFERVLPDRTGKDWIARVRRSLTIVVTSTGPMGLTYGSISRVVVCQTSDGAHHADS